MFSFRVVVRFRSRTFKHYHQNFPKPETVVSSPNRELRKFLCVAKRALSINLRTPLCIAAAALFVIPAFAQYDQLPQVGLKQFAQYQHSDVDSVDLSSGNVSLHIPLVGFPQIGGKLRLNFFVRYNEPQWGVLLGTVNMDGNGNPVASGSWRLNLSEGRPIGVDVVRDQGITAVQSTTSRFAPPACNYCDPDPVPFYSITFGIRDRTGAEHDYGMQSPLQNAPNNGTTVTRAPDGSGWVPDEESMAPGTYNLPSTSFHDRDGLHYVSFHPSGAPGNLLAWNISDAHGNTISTAADGWNDTMGRHIPGSWTGQGSGENNAPNGGPPLESDPYPGVAGTDTSGCGNDQTYIATRVWTVPSSADSGGSQTYTFCYAKHEGSTTFTTTKLGSFRGSADQGSFSVILLGKIILPNSTSYTFQYDPQFLELTQLTLPTGGIVTYQYAQIPWEQCSTSMPVKRVVVQRTEIANSNQVMVWKYRWPQNGVCDPEPGFSVPVVVTNPDGNDVWHYESTNASNQIVNGTIFYQGTTTGDPNSPSGTMLKKVESSAPLNNSILFGTLPETEAPDSTGAVTLLPGNTYQMQFPGPVIKTVTTLYAPVNQTIQSSQESDATPIPSSGNVEYINPINYYYPQTGTCACIVYSGTTATQDYDMVQGSGTGPGTLLRQTTTNYRFLDIGGQSYSSTGLTNLPSSLAIQDGSGHQMAKTTYSYDESSYAAGVVAGELTTTQRLLGASTWLATHTKFNSSGVFAGSFDAMGTETRVTAYDCSGLTPSNVTSAYGKSVTESSAYAHDCNTGAITSYTDPNNKVTSYGYADSLNRITSVSYPDGGSVQVTYNDGSNSSVNLATATGGIQGAMSQTVIYDLLGRTVDVQTSAPEGIIHRTTDYDPMGRVWHSSNPFVNISDATYGLTTNSFDALGRVILQTNADGTTSSQTYNGNLVTFTDGAGRRWQQSKDALGRLASVTEQGTSSSPLSLRTNYTYDALGNIQSVNQQGVAGETPRTRSFQYDSLSRLIAVYNPESGWTCYGTTNGAPASATNCSEGYDANGNLLHKTDALGWGIDYTYDELNRLLTKSSPQDYNTNQHYTYDQGTNGIGRLSTGSIPYDAGTSYEYDPMGRVTGTQWFNYDARVWQTGMGARYDLAGNVTDLTYPSGRTVHQDWDAAGRLKSLTDTTPGGPGTVYFSASPNQLQYTPAGALANASLGDGLFTETLDYNSRLQRCRSRASSSLLAAASNNGGNLYDRQSYFNPAANSPCGNEPHNNGNIFSIVDNRQVGLTQSFNYDSLNRLISGARSDGAYNQNYNYDSFGNMLLQDIVHTTPNYSIDPGTNRLLLNNGDLAYYPNGWLSNSPGHTYSWTAEGNLRSIDSFSTGSYLYNAEGQRTLAVRNDYSPYSSYELTQYVYFGGQPMAVDVKSPSTNWTHQWTDYIYANGEKIAKTSLGTSVLHLSGSNVPNSGSVASGVDLGGLNGITLQQGDTIRLWQLTSAENGIAGGIWLGFTNGDYSTSWSHGRIFDSDGQEANLDGITGSWHKRTIDLSAWAGLTVNRFLALDERNGAVNQFDIYFADIALQRADGSVVPIWTGTPGISTLSATVFGPGSATASVDGSVPQNGNNQAEATHYYLADHLGSTQMELSSGGWPIWQGQFTPFGQEIVAGNTLLPGAPDGSSTRFKFTGKERDSESGLDYFGARYYGSGMGRFMSPDPIKITEDRVANPNTLNLYSYAANNPLKYVDPDGQDITYFYDQAGTAGHAVLFAYNQQTGDGAIESFGPIVHTFAAAGESMFDLGPNITADKLRQTYAALTIQASPELTQRVIDYIRANPDPANWLATGPNCSTQCSKILKKFQFEWQRRIRRNMGNTPAGLWEDLREQYNPNAPKKPTGGLDYGAPRRDMFGAFWMQIQQNWKDDPVEGTPKRNSAPPCLKSRDTGNCV